MKPDEIYNLRAGRKTDRLVAELVLKLKPPKGAEKKRNGDWLVEETVYVQSRTVYTSLWPPNYSTNIAAAWQVVEAMELRGFWAQMRTPFGRDKNKDGYWCGFMPHMTTSWNGAPDDWTVAPTLPLAVCRAALRNVDSAATHAVE